MEEVQKSSDDVKEEEQVEADEKMEEINMKDP